MTKWRYLLLITVLVLSSLSTAGLSAEASKKAKKPKHPNEPISLQLLGITDFHGYLQALNDTSNGTIASPDGPVTVGGAAYVAAHLNQLEQGYDQSIRLSVGDNFSGWPFEVASFRNEPTIEYLNAIDVELTAVGNHELDETASYMQDYLGNGECFGVPGEDSCFEDSTGKTFSGSEFDYLSANIRYADSGKLVSKPYIIKEIPAGNKGRKIKVGFLGLTTTETILGTTSFQEGELTVDPLLEAAERYTKELNEKGVKTIVAVVHEGGTHDGYFNGCTNPRGPVVDFAKEAPSEIDAIFTGHWHGAFNCMIDDPDGNPRPVIEGSNHGRLISEVVLSIDPITKDAIRNKASAENHAVTRTITPDPEIASMVSYWKTKGDIRYAEPLAQITGSLTRARNTNGESTLANVAADAHLAAGKQAQNPADFALTAASPLRGDLLYEKGANPADEDGLVLFGEQWYAHGYDNPVVVVSLTGKEIAQILEEQWRVNSSGVESFHPLAVSYNVAYSFDRSKPRGQRVSDIIVDDETLVHDQTYRVAALAYLIRGNDGYPTFLSYKEPERTLTDRWAFIDYLKTQGKVDVPALDRVSGQ